jgi:hypothetical protein
MLKLINSYTKNILANKSLFFILNKKMQSDENKRMVKGTEHSIKIAHGKLNPEYVKKSNPEFLAERLKIWDELYAQQTEKIKNLPREQIMVKLKDGKLVEGVSFETTPLDIAKKNLKKSLVPDLIVAKV